MSLSAHETALLNFGRDALAILETDNEWSSDTLAALSESAEAHGLARADEAGLFERVPASEYGGA
jgi:hypothetical protein